MPASSNFNQAIREAQTSSIVGPNVISNALPYVGGGMALTGLGVLGGFSLIQTNPALFQPLALVAIIAELILFFIASSAANNANNSKALPLLAAYSVLTGFTLSGLIFIAQLTIGMGAVFTAVFATGVTFVIASFAGQRMSDNVGQALSKAVVLGLIGLFLAIFIQMIGGWFNPDFFWGSDGRVSGLELMISGFGTILFVGMAFVDFYTMPRRYRDDQYLAGALGMYLTYINLFVFILRLMIALNGGGRRD
ncbi:Bax inhibitor-1 family protein [Prochlorococcus sp. AH-716-M18]|nr:Bax inhibitor-1 family protein [Prochlorococcus sp. AH-716-M18]